jgi:hypothetical protein
MKLTKKMADALYGFEVVSTDPIDNHALCCMKCGETLCTIEPGDNFSTLVGLVLDHTCKAKP